MFAVKRQRSDLNDCVSRTRFALGSFGAQLSLGTRLAFGSLCAGSLELRRGPYALAVMNFWALGLRFHWAWPNVWKRSPYIVQALEPRSCSGLVVLRFWQGATRYEPWGWTLDP